MSYGYGRNDPDNWDTDSWGRPIDPDWVPESQPKWTPDPPRKVPPMDLYGSPVACIDDYDHRMCGDSGYGECSRCRFKWQRLHVVTYGVVIGTGAIVLDVGQARTELKKGDKIGSGT